MTLNTFAQWAGVAVAGVALGAVLAAFGWGLAGMMDDRRRRRLRRLTVRARAQNVARARLLAVIASSDDPATLRLGRRVSALAPVESLDLYRALRNRAAGTDDSGAA